MDDRTAIRAGIAGTVIAAICCATPILAVVLPLVGLGAWVAGADLAAFSLLAASLGLIGWGLYRRWADGASGESDNQKNHKKA